MTDHKMADGCCSARTPCAHQCKDPTTICDTCRAASPSVSAWLAAQEAAARGRADDCRPASDKEQWHRAQAAAYEAAHAYAVARPDRSYIVSDKAAAAQIVSARLCASQEGYGSVEIRLAGGLHVVLALGAPLARVSDPARLPMVPDIADADLAYLAGIAISSKDATLARIAAALLLAR